MVETEVKVSKDLPKLGTNTRFCGNKYLFIAEQELEEGKPKEKVLLPLNKVDIKSQLRGATAYTNVELTYSNPSTESAMECTYVFPLEKNTLLAKFEAVIDGKVVETKIMKKEKAQERYDDAVAGGHAAVMAERKKKDESMTIKLGNLLPGQAATLKVQIVHQLEVVGGHYALILPVAFYPDYKRHGVRNANDFVYEFSYEVKITADGRISNLSIPENAEVVDKNDTNSQVTVQCSQTSRTIDLYYKTGDMLVPQLVYAESPDKTQIACTVCLVPTFDPVAPQDVFAVVKDEKPESMKLAGNGSDYHFIFLVDRSGSMQCNNRMQIAKDALSLFMKSLPEACKFTIISFGTRYNTETQRQPVEDYTDGTKAHALEQISGMAANFGGTDIYNPLKSAQEDSIYNSGKKKRVFILTDGCVGNAPAIQELAKKHSDTIRVFTFGLGSGCDVNLVTQVAKAGRGTHTIVKDGSADLNGQVIRALSNAMEPSLKGAQYGWNGEVKLGEEVYRNSLISAIKLCTVAEFEAISFYFKTEEDPETHQTIDLNFSKADFKKIDDPIAAEGLFKMGVFQHLQETSMGQSYKEELSVKHQVLCDETAIIGVMKQENKTTGEVEETTIKFGKQQIVEDDDIFGGMNMLRSGLGARGGGARRGGARRDGGGICAAPMMPRSMAAAPMMSRAMAAPMMMQSKAMAAPMMASERRSSNMDQMKSQIASRQSAMGCARKRAASSSDDDDDSNQSSSDEEMASAPIKMQEKARAEPSLQEQLASAAMNMKKAKAESSLQEQLASAPMQMQEARAEMSLQEQLASQSMKMSKKSAAPMKESKAMAAPMMASERRSSNMDQMKSQIASRQSAMGGARKKRAALSSDDDEDEECEDDNDDDGPQQQVHSIKMNEQADLDMDMMVEESKEITQAPVIAASTAQAQASQQPVVEQLASFESVINLQSSSGFWGSASRSILASCIQGGQTEDAAVRQELQHLGIQGDGDVLESVYLTLLALFILEEVFFDNEDEWQMIAKKAKTYLEQAGIAKANTLIRKFTLVAKLN